MSYQLLLDTSDKFLSVGISKNDELIYTKSFQAWQRQSEFLLVEIKKALQEVKITFKDIDEIVSGIGPGSYTGVRIALTVGKTLACLTNIKLKTVSSLAIMGDIESSYIALINARSGRSYIGIYSFGKVILNDCIKSNEEVCKIINEYKKKGFKIYGELDYLNLNGDSYDIVKGLFSYGKICQVVSNPLIVKPVYLKEAI